MKALTVVILAVGLVLGVHTVARVFAPDATPLQFASNDPRCPAPQPGQRIEIVIRNHGGDLVATCRYLMYGGTTK